jgi:hypothetical protein
LRACKFNDLPEKPQLEKPKDPKKLAETTGKQTTSRKIAGNQARRQREVQP